MINHTVRVHRSNENLAHREQLAYKLAEVAADPVAVDDDVAEMVVNRVIDNAGVAAAALTRHPVAAARAQAFAHPVSVGGAGATIFGANPSRRVSVEWAAWANGVAVRELDFHDTFLAAEYSHPADNIPPLVAVAQHAVDRELTGADLVRGIVAAYETQIDLARGISLHAHKIDHIGHLGPSVAAGIGAMLGLDVETIAQAIGQALHTTTTTRQSRKGEISSWKAFAPAFAGKMGIEAVDRAMRGEGAPAPIYEGEDGVIAWLLDGPDASYTVPLPAPGEPKRGILDSYTKEHSAEYQAQAWIDLARALREKYPLVFDKPGVVERVIIHTSHHTHTVIGSGANDPQKYDPAASRETLDHSLPYIFAVALQDGTWHQEDSYRPSRASRPDTVDLWRRVETVEDAEWTERYHAADPAQKAFGGRVEIRLTDGAVINEEVVVADAHPAGARPFERADYVRKFHSLADGVLAEGEAERFLDVAERLPSLRADQLGELAFAARTRVMASTGTPPGLF